LGRIGDEAGIVPLIEALNRRSPEVRATVMTALANFGPAMVEPALHVIENQKQQRADVVDAVIALLSRVGDERVIQPLVRMTAIPRFATVSAASMRAVMDRLGITISPEEMARLADGAPAPRRPLQPAMADGADEDNEADWQVA
jgi:HEAT repeat protein